MPDQTPQTNNIVNNLASSMLSGQSILDVFVLQDIIELEDADKLKNRYRTNREVEQFLLQNKLVTRETINKAYSILLKLPYISLTGVEIPKEALAVLPEKLARRFGVIAFSLNDQLIRVAITNPADLFAHYSESLVRFFEERNMGIEIFITGDKDYAEAIKQYQKGSQKDPLVKKGSLPVVFLRNQTIADSNLKKLPRDFIERYRLVVFGENRANEFLVASETPDSQVTKRIIDFLEKENEIKVELFATAKEDIDYALLLYDYKGGERPKLDLGFNQETQPSSDSDGSQSSEKINNKISLQNFLDSLFSRGKEDEFTIDERPDFGKFDKDDIDGSIKKPVSAPKTDAALPTQETDVAPKFEEAKEVKSADESTLKEQGSEKVSSPALKKEENSTIEKPVSSPAQGKNSVNSAKISLSLPEKKSRPTEGLEEKDISVLLGGKEIKTEEDLSNAIKEGYVPKIVAAIASYSINNRVSDIHIEPGSKHLRVRCRIDGILKDIARLALSFHPPVITRLKILSKLKIDESRVPQDGRFDLINRGREVDVRVSSLPTVNGEKMVLRILDKDQGVLSLEDLGMQGSAFELTLKAIKQPYGIILSTGPTGSGKSTTLYAVLNRLSVPGINIVTLEDPVEYEIPGINQCQVKPEIGFTFASGLRSVLRQDPNVIMVGEIRDAETAAMATHAALTGHLVLSTLHTNDTASTLPRLINMGVEPFLITSSINLVIAQRLIRRVCVHCREEVKVPDAVMAQVKAEMNSLSSSNQLDLPRIPSEFKLYYGRGCKECNQGYRGRIGIFEVMEINSEVEDLAVSNRPAAEIKAASVKNGMLTMRQDGIIKALAGLTTIDEVLQATSGDNKG